MASSAQGTLDPTNSAPSTQTNAHHTDALKALEDELNRVTSETEATKANLIELKKKVNELQQGILVEKAKRRRIMQWEVQALLLRMKLEPEEMLKLLTDEEMRAFAVQCLLSLREEGVQEEGQEEGQKEAQKEALKKEQEALKKEQEALEDLLNGHRAKRRRE